MKFALPLRFALPRRAPLTPRAANPHFARRHAKRARRLSFLMFLPIGLAALLIGAVAGLDAPILLALVAGSLFALGATFVVPAHVFLQAMFVVTFLVQGSALYFGGVRPAPWIAAGMAGLFIFRVLMDFVFERRALRGTQAERGGAAGVLVATCAYLGVYAVAIVLNRPSAGQLVSAVKSNLLMFGVLASFMWFYWAPERMERLWKIALWIMVLQLPVTFYQHFFIATQRHNGFDSVVGTFGGTPLGGGLSSMLVLFVVGTMAYALARWNRGLMRTRSMLFLCALGVGIIMLGEVKAAFLWLPICVFVVLRKRILRNVFSVTVYGALAALLLGGIYHAYDQLYWTDSVTRFRTHAEQERADNYFFDTQNIDYETGEISRGASLALWWKDRASSVPQRLLGNGPGASKSAGQLGGGGPVAKRFAPLSIDATALAMLLWDVGVAGALCYTAILLSGIWTGWKYLRRGEGSARQLAMVETSTGLLCVFFTMLIYNRTQLDEPTVQLMLMFCLGCVVQMARFRRADASAPLPHAVEEAPRRAANRAPPAMVTPVFVGS